MLTNMYVNAHNRDWDFVYHTVYRDGMVGWVGRVKGDNCGL